MCTEKMEIKLESLRSLDLLTQILTKVTLKMYKWGIIKFELDSTKIPIKIYKNKSKTKTKCGSVDYFISA